MTKYELIKRYRELLDEKKINNLDGISKNSSKSELLNAIACLECSDEELDKCAEYIGNTYPAMYKTIMSNGNFKFHFYNRLFVFNTARISA